MSTSRKFSIGEINSYRLLTGDKGLGFAGLPSSGQEIIPGPLLGGMISELLGTKLPGPGTNWLKQRYQFLKPGHVDCEVTATMEITRLRPEKHQVSAQDRSFDCDQKSTRSPLRTGADESRIAIVFCIYLNIRLFILAQYPKNLLLSGQK